MKLREKDARLDIFSRLHLLMQVFCERFYKQFVHPGDFQDASQELLSKKIDKLSYSWQMDMQVLIETLQRFDLNPSFLSKIDCQTDAIYKQLSNFLTQCEHLKHQIITYNQDSYPPLLRHIRNPPHALCLSNPPGRMFLKPCLAVVGSRRVSVEALNLSENLGCALADHHFTVVSGGAYGVDIATHLGVKKSQRLRSAACIVFAGDLQNLYPLGNRHIFSDLQKKGACLLSERIGPCQTKPRDFPVRNRIISGLSTHIIIVEANLDSGAILTAKAALDQGREVLVWQRPANLFNGGNHQLIEDGARTFETIPELLHILNEDLRLPT